VSSPSPEAPALLRGRAGWALALFAGALLPALTLALGLSGRWSWEAWVHDAAGHFDWTPFIHPPLYNELLWLGEQLGAATDVRPAVLLAWLNVPLCGLVAAEVGRATARRSGHRWAALAVALVASSAAVMRPFEQYPVSRLLLVLSVLGLLELARPTGAPRRALAVGTFAACFVSVELHVNAWVVLAPLLLGLALANPARRRPLAILAGALLLAFGLTALRGLPTVLADGPMNGPGWRPPMRFAVVTLERLDPALLAVALLWLLPAARRAATPRLGGALLVALALYVGVVSVQMFTGLAIGGDFERCHHYYELVDALAVLAAVWALADARAAATSRGWRGALAGLTVALVVVHALVLAWSWRAMDAATAWGAGPSWM
jgi:hypothetical protein